MAASRVGRSGCAISTCNLKGEVLRYTIGSKLLDKRHLLNVSRHCE